MIDTADEDMLRITELYNIVPSWREVDLTKKGYNEQYLQTLTKLNEYIKRQIKLALEEKQDDMQTHTNSKV